MHTYVRTYVAILNSYVEPFHLIVDEINSPYLTLSYHWVIRILNLCSNNPQRHVRYEKGEKDDVCLLVKCDLTLAHFC